MKRRTVIMFLWLFALIVWNVVLWEKVQEGNSETLTVAFFDVGQGDAIFIQAPNGRQMLIDGGPDEGVLDDLKEIMPFADKSIDVVLATHPHSDHIAGLRNVLESYDVATIVDNGRSIKESINIGTYDSYKEDVRAEQAEGAKYVKAVQGMRIIIDPERNIYFDILYPTASSTEKEVNEYSIVGKLVYGVNEFMLTGDTYTTVEEKLVKWCKECLNSDVLKVGHHGSRTSTGNVFIEAVHPTHAIISAAKNNLYGHPSPDVINRLEEYGIITLETSKEGTIIFETDGVNLERK